MPPESVRGITDRLPGTTYEESLPMDEEEALRKGLLTYIGAEVDDAYIAAVKKLQVNPELAREMGFLSVENSRPDLGLSHTIALGMAHMQDMDAVLFQVSDQPLLRRDSVERLVEVYRSHPDRLVALGHDGVRGNPCLFPASLFPELLALEGDHGGSAVIRRHEDRLLLVEASPRELTDVDTPQALEVLTGEKTV